MRNKGCVGRPYCNKPQPPRHKPAGTPGAIGKTLIGRFQETGKRNTRLRAGSTSGEQHLGGKRLQGKPPEGTQVCLQKKVADATPTLNMEVARGVLEETVMETPPKPPDQHTESGPEVEELGRAGGGEQGKEQDVRIEPPPLLQV